MSYFRESLKAVKPMDSGVSSVLGGGSTLTEKNAVLEFFLKIEDVNEACEKGELKFRWKSCHGHSYRLFNRSDIAALAARCEPDPALKAKHDNQVRKERVKESKEELESVTKELANMDKRKAFLNKRKGELEEYLKENDVNKAIKKPKLLR
jgi:hypothetical protein